MKLPEQPVIETKRLVLRLLDKSDLPALFAVNGDAEVFRYSPRESWKTPADGEAWFARVLEHRQSGATLQFVIVLRDGGRPIGTLAMFHFDESVGSAELGYALGREHWGKGLMREALAGVVEFGFENLGLKRLEAELDPRNAASVKVLERVGFSDEGRRRRNYFSKGEVTDTGLYGMLSEDPRPASGSESQMSGDIALRAVAQSDLSFFFEHQNDLEANRLSASSPRDQIEFSAHWAKTLADPAISKKTILYRGKVVGYVASFERFNQREVCYWLGREAWGKGIASIALRTFLEVEKGRPLWARAAKQNAASIRVLEKCGFRLHGEDKYSNRAGEQVEEFIFQLSVPVP